MLLGSEKKIKEHREEYNQSIEFKERMRKYQKEYRQRPEFKAKKKEYYQRPKVKERVRKYMREYYKNNKKTYLGYIKKYQTSKKGIKKIKEYMKEYNQRQGVKERRRKYMRELMKDESHRLKHLFYKRLRRTVNSFHKYGRLRLNNLHVNYYLENYGVNFEKITMKLRPLPKDIKNYEIDHIIPLSKFDFTKKGDIKKAYSPSNIRLILSQENRKKGNRLIQG